MKKIIIIFSILVVAACKKDRSDVSQVHVVSAPTIDFGGNQFYSIHLGDPAPVISATAYDSLLGEAYDVEYDPSVIDNNAPGLYVVPMSSTNKYGFVGTGVVYVAVTDIDPSIDLSGTYVRTANGEEVHITKVENGLYETDDVGGAAALEVTAYFVMIDTATLELPPQPTIAGTLSADFKNLTMQPGDTSITWAVINPSFGPADRTFVKQ